MPGWLVAILIAIAVGAMIILVVKYITDDASVAAKETACRSSTIIKGKATLSFDAGVTTVSAEKVTPLICESIDQKELEGNRDDLKRQISDLSAKCWWQFAEGRFADLFENDEYEKGCRVCYTFKLPSKIPNGQNTPAERQFMNEPYPLTQETISQAELFNFMGNNYYNPGLIYGGGTREAISAELKFEHEFEPT